MKSLRMPKQFQVPTGNRNNMPSNRVELQRSKGSSSRPKEQQVHAQIQVSFVRVADYLRVRGNSPARLIARATRKEINGRKKRPVRKILRLSRREAEKWRDRYTLRPQTPGARIRTDNPLRIIPRPASRKTRGLEHQILSLVHQGLFPPVTFRLEESR